MKNNLVKKIVSIVAISAMTASILAGCGEAAAPAPAAEEKVEEAAVEEAAVEEEAPVEETTAEGELPRNETLYFAGQQ